MRKLIYAVNDGSENVFIDHLPGTWFRIESLVCTLSAGNLAEQASVEFRFRGNGLSFMECYGPPQEAVATELAAVRGAPTHERLLTQIDPVTGNAEYGGVFPISVVPLPEVWFDFNLWIVIQGSDAAMPPSSVVRMLYTLTDVEPKD